MTPEQRRAVREMIAKVELARSGDSPQITAREWFGLLNEALDQMDADEGLMRQAQAACEAVVSIADAAGEGPFASALSGAELATFVAALEASEVAGDALRARLGEVPAQGEEAPDGEAKA